MPRVNYNYNKRQREIAKKQKKEEKRQRKQDAHTEPGAAPVGAQPTVPSGQAPAEAVVSPAPDAEPVAD